jgi:hypothetical protein
MSLLKAFQPAYGTGITETATSPSASYVCDPAVKRSGGGSKAVVVTNQGNTNGLYVKVGAGAQTADDTGYYVPPGGQACLSKAETDDQIGLLAAAGTTPVHVIVGEGF